MEGRLLKIVVYVGFIAVIAWVVAKQVSKRQKPPVKPFEHRHTKGSMWVRNGVPASDSGDAPSIVPGRMTI